MNTHRVGGATVFTSKDFSSKSNDHRARVRLALQKQIESDAKKLSVDVDSKALHSLLDLKAPPRIEGWGISVSHCPDIGGFAILPGLKHIGLDFEIATRLTDAIVYRVASFDEEKAIIARLKNSSKTTSPNAYFWCAKEASIKVCGHTFRDQSVHYSNVELLTLDADERTFTAKCGLVSESPQITGEFFDVQSPGVVAALAFSDRLITRQ